MRAAHKPTVVIAEDQILWEVGIDFSSALRERGLRVVRLLSPESSSTHFARRTKVTAVLSDQIVLNAYEGQTGLSPQARAELANPDLLDVQCGEGVLERIFTELDGKVRPPVTNLPVREAIDKIALHHLLAERGVGNLPTVGHPDDLPANTPGPYMVKQRAGAGGESATRCETLDQVREIFAREPAGTLIVQPFINGEVLDTAGVALNGEVIQAAAYRNVTRPADPYGAALAIVMADIPDLLELTRDVVQAMGINGPFAIDAVRDQDGQLLTLDVNLRIFGCWTALQEAGIDVVGSYLHSLNRAPHPGPATVKPGNRYELLRFDQDLAALGTTPTAWLAQGLRVVRARRNYLGNRWAAITLLRVGKQAADRVRPSLRRR